MNQHLPPETVKEIGTIPAGTIAVRPTEQFSCSPESGSLGCSATS
jgi:hypothetical protein